MSTGVSRKGGYVREYSTKKRQRQIFRFALNSGANLQSPIGTRLLFVACNDYPLMVLPLLRRGADVGGRDFNGYTPLMFACQRRPSVAKNFLDYHSDVNATDTWGWSPLMFICSRSTLEVGVATLLLDRGADVNHANHKGATPLSLACKYNPPLVELLVSRGVAFSSDFLLRAYYNILVYLNQGGTSQILPLILALVRAGADPNPEDKGQTLLQQVEKDFSELEHGELAVLLALASKRSPVPGSRFSSSVNRRGS